jgi:hypothetical protein
MPIPVLANFRARGMAPNVVGGKRTAENFSAEYTDTATGVIAPASLPATPGRILMYDTAGDTDAANAYRGKRRGVKAVTSAFVAADFAGILIRRYASPVYGAIPSANTVNDTTTNASVLPGEVVSRAVARTWYVEFDSATPPTESAAVFVDNSSAVANYGRVSASVGVTLTTARLVFTGEHEQGWDGKYYAGVRFVATVN